MSNKQIPRQGKRPLYDLIDSDPEAFVALIARIRPILIELLGLESTLELLKWWIIPNRTGYRSPRVVTEAQKAKEKIKLKKPEIKLKRPRKDLPPGFLEFKEKYENDPNKPVSRRIGEGYIEEEINEEV